MFIGREKELEYLDRIHKQSGFHVVLIGGKKGVGKTTLLEEFCKRKDSIFFIGSERNGRMNLSNFSIMIRSHFNDIDRTPFSFPFWKSALEYIAQKSNGKRVIIVLDNLSSRNEKVFTIIKYLQHAVEQELLNNNIMLILSTNDINFYNNILIGDDALSRRIYASIFINTVPEEDVQKLLMNTDKAKMLRFSEDEIVLREGEINNDMYKIISGHAVYYFNYGTDKELVIGGLRDGNTFGEYSLLTGKPGIYTVVAFSELLVLRISRTELERFITINASNFTEIMHNMAKMLNVMKVGMDMLSGDQTSTK